MGEFDTEGGSRRVSPRLRRNRRFDLVGRVGSSGLAPAREAVTGARTHPVIKRTPTEVKAVAGKAAPVPSTDSRLIVLIAAPSRIK